MLRSRYKDDSATEAGIDEAGRGCLWGPLVAAAVILPVETAWTDEMRKSFQMVKDSKKLTPKRRQVLAEFLKTNTKWSIGRVEAAEIDSLGMTRANRTAFERALEGLTEKPERLIIDGILSLPDVDTEQCVEAEADGTYLAVAAASILAKETRDQWVIDQCQADPVLNDRYGLLSSKGYGTAVHRAGVLEHGMDSQHRRLFLRKLLGYQMVDD